MNQAVKKANSRLPFFFGFKVFGFRKEYKIPIWRQFLSDAVIYAQSKDWGTALMHVAFALESFIDVSLLAILKRSQLGDSYQNHLLRVGEKREEFHALLHITKCSKEINKYYNKVNKHIFQIRNKIAHGYMRRESVNPDQYVNAMKIAVEFIWDYHQSLRKYLIPVMHLLDPSKLIDQQIIKNCGSNAILTSR